MDRTKGPCIPDEHVSVKDNARDWTVKEQIIEDASGLTIQFEVVPNDTARYRLRLFGDSLPFGNREILFDVDGIEAGSGTAFCRGCKPTWLTEI
jgi:hypothetical protein